MKAIYATCAAPNQLMLVNELCCIRLEDSIFRNVFVTPLCAAVMSPAFVARYITCSGTFLPAQYSAKESEVVHWLLEHGAFANGPQLTLSNSSVRDGMHTMARSCPLFSCCEFELRLSQRPRKLEAELISCMELLVAAGADVHHIEPLLKVYSPLMHESHAYASAHSATAADFLCSCCCCCCIIASLQDAITPFAIALKNRFFSASQFLLDHGVKVNEISEGAADRASPLHFAAYEGNTDGIDFLLNRGADIDCTDNDGWTPLFWAAGGSSVSSLELLLSRGANLNAVGKVAVCLCCCVNWFLSLRVAC